MIKETITCPKCHGDGGFMPLVPTRYDDGIDCDRCNGKGYLIKKGGHIMNLSDELKKMRNKGRQVVSIDYVLKQIELEKVSEKGVKTNEK